ncbi:MAG: TetR/AcrR family transcriptional regulator [Lachnospiraceae bacterium]|nr:TetR/AcrR family transcriptional regulator [Lachnospiraceae bacterium]
MYHIVNDKRAKVSARLIYEGLLECLKKKPFNKITIRDIQEASGVGRATFYRHFDSLSDVLMAKCDKVFEELANKLDANHSFDNLENLDHDNYLLEVIQHIYDNWEIFEILVSVDRRDILYNCQMRYMKDRTRKYLPDFDENTVEFQLTSHMRAGVLESIINMWLEDDRKEKPEEIVEVVKGEAFQKGISFILQMSSN